MKKHVQRYQHHQRVPKTALPRRRRVATPADKQLSSAQGQRFGLVEDRRLRRIVSNCFPTSRFSRLLNSQQHQVSTNMKKGPDKSILQFRYVQNRETAAEKIKN